MAKVFIEESSLSAIGDAIRAKTGKKNTLTVPNGMVDAINSIDNGANAERREMNITANGTYFIPDGVIVTSITVNVHTHNWSAPYVDPSFDTGYAMKCQTCGEVIKAEAQGVNSISLAVGEVYDDIYFDMYEADIDKIADAIVTVEDPSIVSCALKDLDGTNEYYVVMTGLKEGSTTVWLPQLSKLYNVTVTKQ